VSYGVDEIAALFTYAQKQPSSDFT
jgi:hypothetical protein